jgi:hypothetical protein
MRGRARRVWWDLIGRFPDVHGWDGFVLMPPTMRAVRFRPEHARHIWYRNDKGKDRTICVVRADK